MLAGNSFTENFTANVPVAGFIQAVLLMSVLEQRLSFWILCFVTHHEVVVKCIWVPVSSVTGIFLSTFLQPSNGSKNSILNSVTKLNLFMCSKPLKYFPFYSTIHLSDYFCSQKECQKCIFQQYGDLTFKHPHKDSEVSNNQTVKKLNLWEKTAVDKNARIKACVTLTIDLWWSLHGGSGGKCSEKFWSFYI